MSYIRPIFKRNNKDFPTDYEEISGEKLVDVKSYISTEKMVKSFIEAGAKLQTFRNYEFQNDIEKQSFDQAGDFYDETKFDLDNLHSVRNEVVYELNNKTELEQIVNDSKSDSLSLEEKSTEEPVAQNTTDSQES